MSTAVRIDGVPRALLRGTPIDFKDIRTGDVIDSYSVTKGDKSRFHRRKNQKVLKASGSSNAGCDIYTDYDMICKNLDLIFQKIA